MKNEGLVKIEDIPASGAGRGVSPEIAAAVVEIMAAPEGMAVMFRFDSIRAARHRRVSFRKRHFNVTQRGSVIYVSRNGTK